MIVWRVQDKNGRGPYKPGLSSQWADGDSGRICAPWWIELGLGMGDAHSALDNGMHSGCAFRSVEQARQWFSRGELRRLARLGYELVPIDADAIAYETPTQLVIQCERPLRQCVVKGGCVSVTIGIV